MKLYARLFASALLTLAAAAHAEYPDRPIKIVVPYPPGGNIDTNARIVAKGLAERLRQPVTVDNRAGASGIIGSEIVAKAPADGYTLLLGATGSLPPKQLAPQMKLDAVKDFTAASPIARAPLLLIVNPSVPVRSLAEFIAYAKQNPGKLTYGSPGTGSTAHLTAELFQRQTGIKLTHVPYKGSSQAVADLLGGQIDVTFDQLASTLPHIKAGKLTAIAITTASRSPIVPDIPAIGETIPGFEASTTTGLLLPAGAPANVISSLNAAMREVLALPETRARFAEIGSTVVVGSGPDFDRTLKNDVEKWDRVVREANIQMP